MGFNTIEKKSIRYAILKYVVSKAFHIFYKISVTDNSGVKEGDPIIYAPNHQNALIDPLAVLFTRKGQLVFLARSDIFNNKFIASILYLFKMLPVFRIRDGFEKLQKNQKIFDKTIDVISNGNGLAVFPEANHAGYRRLRVLKKGVSRMAFQAEIDNEETLNVKIVPVGIEYEHYYWFRSSVHINYGEAISVKDYIGEYKKDKAIGLNKLNKAIAEGIRPLIADIQLKEEEEYDITNFITEINYNNKNEKLDLSFEDKILLDKVLVKQVIELKDTNNTVFVELITKAKEYNSKLQSIHSNDYSASILAKNKSYIYMYIVLLLMLPLYLIGALVNYIPYKIPYFTARKMPDIQFHATMYFGIGALVSFPFIYTIYFFVLNYYISTIEAIIFLIGSGVIGIFSYEYWRIYLKLKKIYRLNNSTNKDDIIRNREEVINLIVSSPK